jgi:hypothetical protein
MKRFMATRDAVVGAVRESKPIAPRRSEREKLVVTARSK